MDTKEFEVSRPFDVFPVDEGSSVLSVGCLIVIVSESYYGSVISEFDNDVSGVDGRAVMSEYGVEEGA